MIDINNAKFLSVIAPVAIVDDASYTTAEIDTSGFDYLTIVFNMGATDIAMAALSATESDTSGSGHAAISGLDFDGDTDIDGAAAALPSALDDGTLHAMQLDLRGHKRYIDVTATAGDGAAGTFLSAVAILTRAEDAPNTSAAMGCGHVLRV